METGESETGDGRRGMAHGTARHARPAPRPCQGLPEHSVRRHRGPLVRPGTEAPRITESALRFRRFRLCRIAGCAPRSSNRVAPSAGLAAQAHAVCAMHRSERIPPSARGPPATGAAAAGLLLAPLPPGRGGAGPSRGGLGAGQCGVGQHKVHACRDSSRQQKQSSSWSAGPKRGGGAKEEEGLGQGVSFGARLTGPISPGPRVGSSLRAIRQNGCGG